MKKVLGFASISIAAIIVIWTAVAAASIGKEASTLDSTLTAAVHNHEPATDVFRKVSDLGIKMDPAGGQAGAGGATAQAAATGRGPDHWAVIYRTWLTVRLDITPDGRTTGYHIDRAGSMF